MAEASSAPTPRFNPLRQLIKGGMRALLPKRVFVVRGPSSNRNVCLTFDDGPDPIHTPNILDTLKTFSATATFFCIGEKAAAHPEIIRQILADGHTVGSHTYHHVDLSRTGVSAARRECAESRAILTGSGANVKYLRPPWGKMSPFTIPVVAASKMAIALWSMDSMDYQPISAAQVLERVKSLNPGPGDILLFHDDREHTAEALPQVLEFLEKQALRPVTLEALMGRG